MLKGAQAHEGSVVEGVQEYPPGTRRDAHEVTSDLVQVPNLIVNAYLFGDEGAGDGEWVLIDCGVLGAKRKILEAVAERFEGGSRPAAIVLTHGHFDHVGAVEQLAERWDVDVYAHPLELPYLTGRSSYPPPDPSVGGGMMARLSPLYPKGPIDLGERIRALPENGSVPGMAGWRWIHTPGHTDGHVSLFRDEDGVLLAGDAFVTVKQESALAVLSQYRRIHGPPAYFTTDWQRAEESVRQLAELRPQIAATGHGLPMGGEELRRGLEDLAANFQDRAVPGRGRYVGHAARADESGVIYVPPKWRGARLRRGALVALGVMIGVGLMMGRALS